MSRRHTREYERFIKHSESLITRAAITLMTRRLTRTEEVGSLIRDWERPPLRHGRPTVSWAAAAFPQPSRCVSVGNSS
ncbi:hypothetical protein ACFUV2_02050 [Streptomyces pilosus]|uniref:hypothetical protein n=1 Tax=Streptomyces pilosus TaxID=28893 RepID=UPI0036333E83